MFLGYTFQVFTEDRNQDNYFYNKKLGIYYLT